MRRRVWFGVIVTFVLLCAQSASASVILGTANMSALSSGLVGYWPLDGATTNWAKNQTSDLSGQGNTGTLVSISTSTSPVAGKIGQALKFNGTSTYIDVGNSNSWKFGTGDFAVSFWMKANVWTHGSGEPTEYMMLMGNGNYGSNWDGIYFGRAGNYWATNTFPSGCGVVPEGAILFLMGNGTNNAGVCSTSALSPGTWYHVVGVRSGGVAKVYLNGVLQQSATINYNVTVNRSLDIGKQNDATYPRYFNGTIDDVRIYNRALSAQVVALLYAAGQAHVADTNTVTLSTGLVGYWPFDGNTTSWKTDTTQDVSGNGNTGALVGMSTTSSPVAGKIGGALNFNGSTSYISTPAINIGTGPVTFAAWVKGTSLPSNQERGIFSVAGGINNWNFTLERSTYNPPGLVMYAGYQVQSPNYFEGGNWPITDTSWHYVTMTRSSSVMVLYFDGVQVASSNNTNFTNYNVGNNVIKIGYPSGTYWSGAIDDVRVYNRALSVQEVQQLYALGQANLAHSNTVTLSTGLVGHWPLNGPATSWKTDTTQDTSGNGNTGTLVGMSTTSSPVAGKIGGALKFNGTSSYISTATNAGVTASTPFSISVWAKASASNGDVLVNSAPEASPYDGVWFAWGGSSRLNKPVFAIDSTGGTQEDINASTALSLNTWYHIVVTYDGSQIITGMKIYVNGVQVATTTAHNTGFGSFTNRAWRIGTDAAVSPTDFFPGSIDDVRIYNRALSAQEVAQLYLLGK